MGRFELAMCVPTGAGARIRWKAKAVEDRAQRQDCDDQDRQLKVMELRRRSGMASGVSDQPQGDGAPQLPCLSRAA
jgi:hypothetical protein